MHYNHKWNILYKQTFIYKNDGTSASKLSCYCNRSGSWGVDPGAIGPSSILEKDINLQIALKLYTLIEEWEDCCSD